MEELAPPPTLSFDEAIEWRKLKRLSVENPSSKMLRILIKRAPILSEVVMRSQFYGFIRKFEMN